MNIAIDARIINSSTGRYVERLLHYLELLDQQNRYFVLVRRNDENYWQPKNPNFKVLVAEFDNYSLSEQFGFKRFLDDLGPNLVHFCMPQQPILYRGHHVTTVHDLTLLKTYNSDKGWLGYHVKQAVGRLVFKKIGRTSSHIFTPSEYTKSEYVAFAGIDPDKVVVTYEAADLIDTGKTEPYPLPFSQYLLYVGQQSDYKNIRRLAEAHQKLLSCFPGLGLVLVGKINKSAALNRTYFSDHGYKNIVFTDFIPDEQLAFLYKNCAAYVFPSLMEGFGLPGLEAMAYGAPVVSSSATALPEVYGDAAWYFNPAEVDDMARAIREVIGDESLRNRLIIAGKNQVAKYSWKRMAEQTLAVYKKSL